MRQVALPGTDITTSALGYGCGGLMARMRRPEAVSLLEHALEAGVTHFDVARMYGYGEAESAVGDFLRGRRDRVTLTTKLGIAPPRRSAGLNASKVVARRIVERAPVLRRAVRRGATQLHRRGQFGVPEARASLETSLRELRTDYVDLLLLHECGPEDLTGELLDFLRECMRDGRIRHFGTATDPESTRRILDENKVYAQVIQMKNSVLSPAAEFLGDAHDVALLSHSVLSDALDAVHAHVIASQARTRAWSDAVGADCSRRATLAGLMLAEACWAGPASLALFSSRHAANIRANVQHAHAVSREQVESFTDLVARELRSSAVAG